MSNDSAESQRRTLESREGPRDGATLAANILVGTTLALLIVALVVLVLLR